ncbi:hypothetical protein [Nakamurella sp. PAMC28650]|uniref:hypothetical protein n=1 Tax=Nakamurella sp. PAMC28650 TaxID=2762325 RepID=UPI00164E0EF3|nr:hypothetical protein [Nakamurella sp. PAMC28650]QNK80174.1 hypothetical protein H7F38_18460 [Nakamurella sp. PAMC28650]
MTGPTLHGAVEELYSSPTAEFTRRRKLLSVAARSGGDRELAVQIAALRKPTLSADTLNRLVREAPQSVQELVDLGTAFRSAEKELDATALRELSRTRRSLVHDLAQLAFDITEQTTPSASTREEVVATLNAALADEEVADRLMSGSLVTQARWDGFGSASLPELAAVIPMPRARSQPAGRAGAAAAEPGPAEPEPGTPESAEPEPAEPEPAGRRPAAPDPGAAQRQAAQAQATERAAAEQRQAATRQRKTEEERLHRLEAARREAEEAGRAAAVAVQEVAEIDRRISELGLQIAHQRELLAVAQRSARSTEIRRRAAQLALTRAGGSASG